jgi:2-isopropylmalate synthase
VPRAAVDAVRFARQHTVRRAVLGRGRHAQRFDFLCRVVEAVIEAGATTINLPDTVGYSTPDETRDFFSRIRERVPNADAVVFSAHCHDDLGLGRGQHARGRQGGARQVECTVNGIGERAGNAALEEIVMALRVRRDRMPYTTGIDTRQIYPRANC